MLASFLQTVVREKYIVVNDERGLIGWIIIGLLAGVAGRKDCARPGAMAASPTLFLGWSVPCSAAGSL